MEKMSARVFQDVTADDLGQIRQYVRGSVAAGGCDPAALDELVVAEGCTISREQKGSAWPDLA